MSTDKDGTWETLSNTRNPRAGDLIRITTTMSETHPEYEYSSLTTEILVGRVVSTYIHDHKRSSDYVTLADKRGNLIAYYHSNDSCTRTLERFRPTPVVGSIWKYEPNDSLWVFTSTNEFLCFKNTPGTSIAVRGAFDGDRVGDRVSNEVGVEFVLMLVPADDTK